MTPQELQTPEHSGGSRLRTVWAGTGLVVIGLLAGIAVGPAISGRDSAPEVALRTNDDAPAEPIPAPTGQSQPVPEPIEPPAPATTGPTVAATPRTKPANVAPTTTVPTRATVTTVAPPDATTATIESGPTTTIMAAPTTTTMLTASRWNSRCRMNEPENPGFGRWSVRGTEAVVVEADEWSYGSEFYVGVRRTGERQEVDPSGNVTWEPYDSTSAEWYETTRSEMCPGERIEFALDQMSYATVRDATISIVWTDGPYENERMNQRERHLPL